MDRPHSGGLARYSVCLAGVGANDDPSSVAVIADAVGDTPRGQYKPYGLHESESRG